MKNMIRSFATTLSLILLAAGATDAQSAPCETKRHRQFDFWIGDWEVTSPDGTVVGTNRIERILDGCVLMENWEGSQATRGHSFNMFAGGKWHQTWVDNVGRILKLEGGLEKGVMVLSGERQTSDGKTAIDQIRWEVIEGGAVRQHWRISTDGGRNWADAFVGIYRPAAAPSR